LLAPKFGIFRRNLLFPFSKILGCYKNGITLVAKVVGNAKMHISTKNGTMVPKFAVELAQTMVIFQGRPRELLPGSTSL
jgi:hypothetical protein